MEEPANMMMSWNGNIFCVHRWIPPKKPNDAELWCFLWSAPEQRVTSVTPVIWGDVVLIMTSLMKKSYYKGIIVTKIEGMQCSNCSKFGPHKLECPQHIYSDISGQAHRSHQGSQCCSMQLGCKCWVDKIWFDQSDEFHISHSRMWCIPIYL